MTATIDEATVETTGSRDPQHCTKVRWCESLEGHEGQCVREIGSCIVPGSRAVPGAASRPVILAVRVRGSDRVRTGELQVGDQTIILDKATAAWVGRQVANMVERTKAPR